jgi:hypothetical protein
VLWCNQVDVVHIANVLQLDVPFRKLLGRNVEPILLMGDVVILAEDTTKVAAAEKYTAATVVSL